MAEEFHLFLERYKTNVEFLELQNDDDFSGVELLKQGVQDIYGVFKMPLGCAKRFRGVHIFG